MLNGAALPKSLLGEIVVTAVFLLTDLPNRTIGDDTPYYRRFGKHGELPFLRTIGTCPHQIYTSPIIVGTVT